MTQLDPNFKLNANMSVDKQEDNLSTLGMKSKRNAWRQVR